MRFESTILLHQMMTSNIKNNTTVCSRYSKVCVMKGLITIVFIGITVTLLCYSILTLYTRARRHTCLLRT